jgi:tripartite-type tricarboxylate transporter receptor subunit TctC
MWQIFFQRGALGILLLCCSLWVSAQTYPNKTITLIVPFAPGGNIDVIARSIAPSLAKVTGQSVVVENKAGAGGAIGSTYVARAEPDGHTLLVATTNTISVLPYMLKNPPYKPDSFEPVGLAAVSPLVLVVRKDDKRFPDAKSVLQAAKNAPGKVSVGHAGQGTSNHIAILRLEDATKTNFNIIPYKGSAPALTDLMGGQIDFVVDQITSSKPFVDSGNLRILAVLSKTRDPGLPDSPTLREAAGIDLDATTTAGIFAPLGTPPNIVKSLNTSLRKAIDDSGVRGRLSVLGSTARSSTSQEWAAMLNQESNNSQALIQAGKIKAE